MQIDLPQNQTGQIHTVQTLADTEPAFSTGGIRWTIFQFKEKLIESEAIFYSGSKLLIDRDRFITFIRDGGADHGSK